jgi:uncharacterized membrane protein YkvA (DUF1232 family)
MFKRLKSWARHLKDETYALYFAYQDPRVPWYSKALIAFVVIHTFSPIDLIPDFIPVLGYLDDLIITPLGLALALRLIPAVVMEEARVKAKSSLIEDKSLRRKGLMIVAGIWIASLFLLIFVAIGIIR